MGVRQKSDHSTKTRTAHNGDEIFNYKEFLDAAKKYFNSANNEDHQSQTSQETKPSNTEGNSYEKKPTSTTNTNNEIGKTKQLVNPLGALGAGMETLKLMKTELGYSIKPIYQTMAKGAEDFVVDQARDVIGAATGNQMRQGKEYRMATSILGLGNEMFLSTALSMKKGESIKTLKENSDSLVNSINKTLVNKKISANENFEIKRTGDIKNLKRQMDIYARKFAKTEGLSEDIKKILKSKNLSQMSKSELNSLLDQLMTNKGGNVFAVSKNKDLINMVKMSMDLNDNKIMKLTAGGKHPSLFRKGSRILKTALEDDAGYKGYRKTKETYAMAKIMMKATLYEGKFLYKSTKALGNGITKGGAAVFKRVGFDGAANFLSGLNQFGSNVTGGLETIVSIPGKGINAGKKVISNAGQRINQAARNKVRRVTKPVRNLTGKVTKPIKNVAGKVMRSKAGIIVKAPLKIFQFASKAMSAVQALLKKLLLVVIKFIVGLFIGCAGFLVILGSFMALVSAVMFILDALTNIIGEIKQDTSMNAAYEKLLEKESQFSEAIRTAAENNRVEIPQEYQDEYGITEYTTVDVAYIDGTGGQATNSSTIKQILAMAAVYIEQDFNKYGAFLDGKLTDSVYKDYCAKLYDSTHIIAVAPPNPNGSGIYYCSAETVIDTVDGEEVEYEQGDYVDTEGKGMAMENCNNKKQPVLDIIEPSQLDDENKTDPELTKQWEETLEKYKKEYSAVLVDEGRRKREDKDSDYEWINNDYYTIVQSGPHGVSKTVRLDDDSENFDEEMEEAKQQLIDAGCKNPYEVLIKSYENEKTGNWYERYEYVCTCPECKGHLDATTYVFISNIYDPSRDAANGEEGYNEMNTDYEEMPYSMYALDKYATAFDEYVEGNGYFNMYCTNEDCTNHKIYTVVNLKDNMEPTCSLCESQLTMANKSNPGDKASCEEGDSNYSDSNRYQAEKAIMDDITGKDCTIVDWWKNDGWFEDNFFTTETYYRLLDDGDISKAIKEREEDKKNQAEIENNQGETTVLQPVVNKNNSTTYKFQSFTSSTGRNTNFEKHGWDKSSIEQVQLLLAADWEEAYGMSDFGGISTAALIGSAGSSLSEEEIQQMLANNTSWTKLCDDRKALMTVCLSFYSEIQRLGVPYHGSGCSAGSIEQLQNATSRTQYFGKGAEPICPKSGYNCYSDVGCDCSGFVSWILHQVFPNDFSKRETTSSLVSKIGTKLIPVSDLNLQPGDIALKKGHVLMYVGDGLWAEASGHSNGIVYGVSKSTSYLSEYGFYRPVNIDETEHTIEEETEEETEETIEEENTETSSEE